MSDPGAPRLTLQDRLRPGYCQRWHANPDMAGSESIAAHSARVAKIILYFWPDASARLLTAALDHDDGEMDLGDVAGPAKRANPDLARLMDLAEAENRARLGLPRHELTAIEGLRLHLADKLAGVMHVRERRPELVARPDWRADVAALVAQVDEAERMYPGGFAALRAELVSVSSVRRDWFVGGIVGFPGPLRMGEVPSEQTRPFAKDAARRAATKSHRTVPIDGVFIDQVDVFDHRGSEAFDGAALARAEAHEGLADE